MLDSASAHGSTALCHICSLFDAPPTSSGAARPLTCYILALVRGALRTWTTAPSKHRLRQRRTA